MPSKVSQRIKILSFKDKKTGDETVIMLAQRTGFLDVWIGDKHFYYNSMQEGDLSKVDVNQLAQDALPQQPKKTIVVVRRKQ